MEGFVHFREVLSPTAVYVMWWRGKVVYVGKSKNIYARLATHRQNLMRLRMSRLICVLCFRHTNGTLPSTVSPIGPGSSVLPQLQ